MLSDIRLYERCQRGEPLTPEQAGRLLPSRDDVGAVYRQLRRQDGQKEERELLLARTKGELGYGKVCCALDALEELGLIRRENGALHLNPSAGKQNLSQSRLLRTLEQMTRVPPVAAQAVS